MPIAKKGSRRIVVDGVAYRWRVSPWKRLSSWTPPDVGLLSQTWVEQARRVGLGDMADVAMNVTVEASENPSSRLRVRYAAKVVDGFLGFEQLSSITPSLVRFVIAQARGAGWDPAKAGDHRIELVENLEGEKRPALLALPGFGDAPGYEPRIVLVPLTRDE
jgi:hypothetical protein